MTDSSGRDEYRLERDLGVGEYIARSDWNGGPYLAVDACEWCEAPFPEAAANVIVSFDPDGCHSDTVGVCDSCREHWGVLSEAKKHRVRAARANKIAMSRLEKLGWRLIERARR
jgi:hypothetical protein